MSGAATSGAEREAVRAAGATAQQDYSVSGMFNERYGEFMANYRPFHQDIRVSYFGQYDTEVSGETGHFDVSAIKSLARFDVPVDPDGFMTLGVRAEWFDYQFSSAAPTDGDEQFGEVSLIVGGGYFVHEDLLIQGTFEPGLYSDFSGTMTSDDWQFYGNLLATIRQREDLYWHLGLRTSNDFEDVKVFPLLGLAWLPTVEWRVDILLPLKMEVSYLPSASTILKLGLELEGDDYTVRSPVETGSIPFTQGIQTLRLFADATHRFNDTYSMFGRFGSTIAGDFEWNSTVGQMDGTIEPAIFFELGIGLSF